MSHVIGIDLGTGNSVVALSEGKVIKVVENQEGSQTTPSVVHFTSAEVNVGNVAKRNMVVDPKNTVYEIKRLVGRSYNDSEVQALKSVLSYDIKANPKGDVCAVVRDKEYSPPEISAHILRKMKKTAENYLGEEVTKAVITVPAYFNNNQRQATIDAGRIAGLEVLRIINEPTAAALAFCQDKVFKETQHLLIVDFGSGTLDISVLDVQTVDDDGSPDGSHLIEVLSTSGDTHLGGSNLDERLIAYLVDEFKKQEGIDLSKDNLALSRIKDASERAKIELSSMMQTDINLPYITANESGPKHFNVKLTRAKFVSLIEDLVNKIFDSIKIALDDAGLTRNKIHEVLLVGGSTRIPVVQEKIKAFFDKEPNRSVHPDLAVAIGAAIQGSVLAGNRKDILLLDVIPLSLSIETAGDVAVKMVEKNTTVPYSKTETFSTAADNQTAVTIKIAQGEFRKFSNNKTLGRFDLDSIPPAPRGVPQIEVTFSVDANSILTVKAKDTATGKENHITITGSSGLSESEIKQALNDFEVHQQEDEEFAERVKIRNQVDGLAHSVADMLKQEHASPEDITELTDIKNELDGLSTRVIDGSITEAKAELEQQMQKVSQISVRWYERQNAAPGASDGEFTNQENEEPIDADFDFVDELRDFGKR